MSLLTIEQLDNCDVINRIQDNVYAWAEKNEIGYTDEFCITNIIEASSLQDAIWCLRCLPPTEHLKLVQLGYRYVQKTFYLFYATKTETPMEVVDEYLKNPILVTINGFDKDKAATDISILKEIGNAVYHTVSAAHESSWSTINRPKEDLMKAICEEISLTFWHVNKALELADLDVEHKEWQIEIFKDIFKGGNGHEQNT